MQKEEHMFQKRLIELSKIAYHRGIVTYSDFLNLNELNILHSIPKHELYTPYVTYGGYEFSERQMVAFLPDALCCGYQYPITALKIQPIQKKFADQLSHRDYLGSLMNLGIDRSKIGDILVTESETIVFVHPSLESYITGELTRIRYTSVMVTPVQLDDVTYTPKFKKITGSISSVRLDSLLALAFSSSRSKLVTLIETGKVFVNGKCILSNGFQLKEEDIVSVRGMGRFQYIETQSQTKKGRFYVLIHLYI